MSFFLTKSILAVIFLAIGAVTMLCMLALMGKADRKINAQFLRKSHKFLGIVFFLLLTALMLMGVNHVRTVGDQIPLRAVFHYVLALGVFIMLSIKILIVRFYKQMLKYAPVMGMMIFSFSFVIVGITAGYYIVRSSAPVVEIPALSPPSEAPIEKALPTAVPIEANPQRGADIFASHCGSCHHADREDSKQGPGLNNLLQSEKLPHSGRPATVENVKVQLLRPVLTMPAFTRFSDQEMADLLAYLKTL